MLSFIKNKIVGWISYFIIALIIFTLALFGVSEYFTGAANIVVASVGDDDISKEAYLKEFNAIKRRLQQELGKQYTSELNQRVKISTIESMINERVLSGLADELGYATTQHELRAFIQAHDMFKVNGNFSIDRYKKVLRLNGVSESEYESMRSNELRQNQIQANFLDSAFVTSSMLKRVHLLNDQQRKFSYMVLDTKNYSDKVKVEEQSVREVFNKSKEDFFEPQKVKVDFVELSTKQIAKSIQADNDALLNLYENEQERFSTEEERKAQHILVQSEALASTIVKQLSQGDDFAELAAKHSQDMESKNKAGDLGFFTLGMMLPKFEAQVFAMKIGEISAPVKTDFGYHIIKLNEIKAAQVKPFDAVRGELLKLYKEREVQKSLYNLTDKLNNLAYEGSLEEVAEQMDLDIKTSEFFSQHTQRYDAKFVATSYSDEVFNKGENSEVIEIAKDKFVVLRINKKVAKRQKSFDEVKPKITQHLSSLLAKTFIDNTANKIATLLNKGDVDAAQKIIDEYQLKWKDAGWVTRNSSAVSADIIGGVFALPQPTNNGASYGVQNLNNNQSAILKLSAVKTPKSKPDSTLLNVMLHFESEALFDAILKTLRKNTDIEIFEEHL